MQRRNVLASLLVLIAIGLAVNSLLGPLAFEVIEYRFSDSLISQGIGLDFVSIVLVAPLALFAAIQVLRVSAYGELLALGPSAYTAYMSVQYAIGPEYGLLNGNNEQFYLFHLALFIMAVLVLVLAWDASGHNRPIVLQGNTNKWFGWVLVAASLLLALRYLPSLIETIGGAPDFPEYEENATSYLLIGWMDLGLFLPLTLAAGIGLLKAVPWAVRAAYLAFTWYALVGIAVAAMAVVMGIRDDPDASTTMTVSFIVVGVISTILWLIFHRSVSGQRAIEAA